MKKQAHRSKRAAAAVLTITLLLAGCSAKVSPAPPTLPESSAATAPVSSVSSEAVNQGGAYAYMAVVDRLWQEDTALNSDITYLSLDPAGMGDEQAAELTALLEDFCAEQSLTLLSMGYDKLVEEGYVADLFFSDGILFAFEEAQLTDTTLTVTARKWRAGRAAIGGDFTVTKQDGVWSVQKTENQWIS